MFLSFPVLHEAGQGGGLACLTSLLHLLPVALASASELTALTYALGASYCLSLCFEKYLNRALCVLVPCPCDLRLCRALALACCWRSVLEIQAGGIIKEINYLRLPWLDRGFLTRGYAISTIS